MIVGFLHERIFINYAMGRRFMRRAKREALFIKLLFKETLKFSMRKADNLKLDNL